MRWTPYSGRAQAPAALSRGAAMAIDAECGRFFRELIRCLGGSRTELALRLGCNARFIEALEKGDIAGLPPWPETVRIVTGLTAPMGLDPRPALRCLGGPRQASPEAPADKPPGSPRVPPRIVRERRAARPGPGPAGPWVGQALEAGGAWLARTRLLAARLPLRPWIYACAIAAPLAFAAFAARPTVIVAETFASEPFAGLVRAVREFVVYQTAPTRDGLRWIEADDPRLRRGDKLRTAPRKG